uniref:Uncharacterized protein n=1 Tax=Cacopsylla melanoneura TaxID=428564 RepID=A0A8D8Q169_9HEMI
MFGQNIQPTRLKSRKSFLQTTEPINSSSEVRKMELWSTFSPDPLIDPKEEPPPGYNQPYTTWKSLNRLRAGVSRCKYNLRKWGYSDNADCECGEVQTHDHLLICNQLNHSCNHNDLMEANEKAIHVANHWRFKI